MQFNKKGYLGNPNLKQIGEQIEFTQEQILEYAKCAKDPIYFLENYAKIVVIGKGAVPFKPFSYQKRIVKAIRENRKVVCRLGRQLGKSTVVAGYFAWFVMFGGKDTNSAILANKLAVAKEIFSRVQFIIENCPKWLQQGVKEWNKTSLVLENGSRVFCSATSPSAVRGFSLDNIFCDEFGHLNSNLAEEFIASVFPTLSSSKTSKLIIVSTPKGMNHFYNIYTEAVNGTNGFVAVDAHWSENPGRDEKWLADQLAELGELKFRQEVLCDFLGSSATLISGDKLGAFVKKQPTLLLPNNTLKQYAEPVKNHSYVMLVDTARGKGLDYSAFHIINISTLPYQIACSYRDNNISTLVFPEVIYRIGEMYNKAFVLIETNDLGQQVADILFYDLEYENVYMSSQDNIKEGGDSKYSPGLRTTKKTKAVGCDMLKNLIENDKLEVNDAETISEFTTFIRVGSTYKAEEGKHDDLVMCLVMFAYLTTQPVFKDLFDFSLREQFFASQLLEIENQMLPLGFVDRGEPVVEVGQYTGNGWVVGNDDDFVW